MSWDFMRSPWIFSFSGSVRLHCVELFRDETEKILTGHDDCGGGRGVNSLLNFARCVLHGNEPIPTIGSGYFVLEDHIYSCSLVRLERFCDAVENSRYGHATARAAGESCFGPSRALSMSPRAAVVL